MTSREERDHGDVLRSSGADVLALRGALGGTLMGLANLVPGISGGTMLLASGVYTGFIAAIAELTTLRFRARSLVLLTTIVAAAGLAILMLAGTVRDLVIYHRWVMYSLFIGLTLGGVPLLWRMARPATPAVWVAAALAFALMCAMAFGGEGGASSERSGMLILFGAGLIASSAMILPGVSGGYLLLLMGQYENILGTVDQLKRGLLGDAATGAGADLGLVLDALHVVIPLGLGIVGGVVGVSNLLEWLLERYPKATLGALLGLLLGAVVGLWPFQESRPPEIGEVLRGRTVTQENWSSFDDRHWPLRRFAPTPAQAGGSIALVAAGLLVTAAIGRAGREAPESEETREADSLLSEPERD
jgi:putative membrane protein